MLIAVNVRIEAQQNTTFRNPDILHITSPMIQPLARIAISINGQLNIATKRSVSDRFTMKIFVIVCIDLFLATAKITKILPKRISSSVRMRNDDEAITEAVESAIFLQS